MTRDNRPSLEMLARWGYGARGAVYCLVGGLALLAALGSGGRTGGSRDALQAVVAQPFGRVWLAAISLGLFGFALWRVLESVTDADRRGTAWKALGVRAVRLISGLVYLSLAVFAAGLALGWGTSGGGEDHAAQDWTAWLLAKPFGPWLVGFAGAGVAAAGVSFALRGWRGEVTDYLALPPDAQRWAVPMGRIGFVARGVVFVLVGGFVVLAALHGRSSEVRGLGGALRSLQEQPYGWALLALTAAGLIAFGLFGFVQARYRRIDMPDAKDAKAALESGMARLR